MATLMRKTLLNVAETQAVSVTTDFVTVGFRFELRDCGGALTPWRLLRASSAFRNPRIIDVTVSVTRPRA
jgi:hypothetical protein